MIGEHTSQAARPAADGHEVIERVPASSTAQRPGVEAVDLVLEGVNRREVAGDGGFEQRDHERRRIDQPDRRVGLDAVVVVDEEFDRVGMVGDHQVLAGDDVEPRHVVGQLVVGLGSQPEVEVTAVDREQRPVAHLRRASASSDPPGRRRPPGRRSPRRRAALPRRSTAAGERTADSRSLRPTSARRRSGRRRTAGSGTDSPHRESSSVARRRRLPGHPKQGRRLVRASDPWLRSSWCEGHRIPSASLLPIDWSAAASRIRKRASFGRPYAAPRWVARGADSIRGALQARGSGCGLARWLLPQVRREDLGHLVEALGHAHPRDLDDVG